MKTTNIILTLCLSFSLTPAFALSPDFYVQWLAKEITPESYQAIMNPSNETLLYNRTGDSRMFDQTTFGPTQAKLASRANIERILRNYLTNANDSVYLTSLYDWNKCKGLRNIIGIKRGTDEAHAGIYILTAHYDSMDRNNVCAPGADDNSSGVTAILEVARVIGLTSTKATVVFIIADCEETGYKMPDGAYMAYGDDFFITNFLVAIPANQQQLNPKLVRAAIGVDMISYNSPAERDCVYLYDAGQGFDALMTDIRQEMRRWSGFAAENILLAGSNNKSDHYPYFRQKGIPSALIIEKGFLTNPNYHTANDSVSIAGYIDYEYAAKITKGVLGYIARHADVTSIEPGIWRLENLINRNPLPVFQMMHE
ncbi:MAG: M28 family peptidase [Armatimonadetes bacterium]|nr:M28 family peptidase [Armatimonadota bacterium]